MLDGLDALTKPILEPLARNGAALQGVLRGLLRTEDLLALVVCRDVPPGPSKSHCTASNKAACVTPSCTAPALCFACRG